MRVLLVFMALVMPASVGAADLSSSAPLAAGAEEVAVERVAARPRRAALVRTVSVPCVKCRGGGLPWGGLRKTYKVDLPWGGLPDYCPPPRVVRRTVVVTKG